MLRYIMSAPLPDLSGPRGSEAGLPKVRADSP